MQESEIYKRVQDQLFADLSAEHHDKFRNDRFGQRRFAVGGLYPDLILTCKDSKKVDFLVEILTGETWDTEYLEALATLGPPCFVLVPGTKVGEMEGFCRQNNLRLRVGSYDPDSPEIPVQFY